MPPPYRMFSNPSPTLWYPFQSLATTLGAQICGVSFCVAEVSGAIDLHFTLKNKITRSFWELVSALFLERSPQECKRHHSFQKPNAGQNTKVAKWGLILVPKMTFYPLTEGWQSILGLQPCSNHKQKADNKSYTYLCLHLASKESTALPPLSLSPLMEEGIRVIS